jgi:hypothetical protein
MVGGSTLNTEGVIPRLNEVHTTFFRTVLLLSEGYRFLTASWYAGCMPHHVRMDRTELP